MEIIAKVSSYRYQYLPIRSLIKLQNNRFSFNNTWIELLLTLIFFFQFCTLTHFLFAYYFHLTQLNKPSEQLSKKSYERIRKDKHDPEKRPELCYTIFSSHLRMISVEINGHYNQIYRHICTLKLISVYLLFHT